MSRPYKPPRPASRRALTTFVLAAVAAALTATPAKAQVAPAEKPNYKLAAAWTAQKVGRLVFDTSVTPRWFEAGDRFWYSYQTREGRGFHLVDPVKKLRAPLFDHARMAAMLTAIVRQPYDAQHLPFTTVHFVDKDAAFEFDVQIPRDADYVKPKPKTTTTEPGPSDEAATGAGEQQQQRGQQAARGTTPPRNRTLRFRYELATESLELVNDDYRAPRRPRWASLSPDEKTVVFARNHNLFMMDAESYALAQKNADDPKIVEVQLTKDGEEHYSFARTVRGGEREIEQEEQEERQGGTGEADDENARVPAITVIWSRDSGKFAVARRDQRKVSDLWVIDSLAQPRPKLETYRYAMPGEEHVTLTEILVFDRETKAMVKVKAERFKDQQLSIATARLPQRGPDEGQADEPQQRAGGTDAPPPQWLSETPDKLYFTRTARDQKKVDVCVADPATGDVKVLIEERLNTYIETKPLRLTAGGKELLFWSERTGWGHYYLYDAETGTLENAVTSGEFVTTGLEGIDETARAAFITAVGREPGEDPYYPHLYRVSLDGKSIKLLNPGDASHSTNLAESNRYFVDNQSRVDQAPVSTLYDTQGNVVTKLETPDLSALLEAGFKFAEPFKVKADDGVTDIFGVMYKPFDFDPNRKYPIILYVYPGPQTESVTKTFNPRSNNINLAQFGFIVIEVGNRGGNPMRSKWYHNYGYGNLRDYGLADKKAAVEHLARQHAFIDIDRVGIWGHSGGGFMTAAAMLIYPDFFKVGVSESGNHENNIYNNTWSEKHHGLKEVTDKEGKVTFEYAIEKNSEIAKNLKGRILLITGDIDNNVHPANTYRLADAFVKANKRFDMFVVPGARHSFAAMSGYVNWLRADYFCRHLLGEAAESVDIIELNREQQQSGDRGRGQTGRR